MRRRRAFAAAARLDRARARPYLRLEEIVELHALALRRTTGVEPGRWRGSTLPPLPDGTVAPPPWLVARQMSAYGRPRLNRAGKGAGLALGCRRARALQPDPSLRPRQRTRGTFSAEPFAATHGLAAVRAAGGATCAPMLQPCAAATCATCILSRSSSRVRRYARSCDSESHGTAPAVCNRSPRSPPPANAPRSTRRSNAARLRAVRRGGTLFTTRRSIDAYRAGLGL